MDTIYRSFNYCKDIKIKNYTMSVDEINRDTIVYSFSYDDKQRKATLQLREWAKHLHGNAPSGTYYGYYKITLPNGKRVNYSVYL